MSSRVPAIAVIGGGPSGLMAAQVLAEAGCKVNLYERMPSFGRKFLLAGRGGLNLTHSEDFEAFCARYDAPFLRKALEAFTPDDTRRWCEAFGQETFIGSSGRVFPKAMKASPLLRAWLRHLEGLNVSFHPRHLWQGWNEAGELVFEGRAPVQSDAVVLALGGASWPHLGSDGQWVEALGAPVTPFAASNVGVLIKWSEMFKTRFAGSPLKAVALTCGETRFRTELMITHYGLEGTGLYALSKTIRTQLQNGPVKITLDLKPETSLEALERKLLKRGKQSFSTFLRKMHLAPPAINLLREVHRESSGLNASDLARLIKAVPLTITGQQGLARAISSAGGVRFDALTETYELKTRKGVFIAGEMLDWEAPTGGYLLQACFSSGAAAARGALEFVKG